jgi:hypothetical protein
MQYAARQYAARLQIRQGAKGGWTGKKLLRMRFTGTNHVEGGQKRPECCRPIHKSMVGIGGGRDRDRLGGLSCWRLRERNLRN